MLRVGNTFTKVCLFKEALITNHNHQTVRWRKPRWLPVAKSKMFKVPKRPVVPEEETLEIRRLYNNYYCQIKSIRRYLTMKYSRHYQARIDPEELKRTFEEDYERCLQINNKWNEEQKLLREKQISETLEAELDFARNRIVNELLKRDEKLAGVEEIVRREKEASKYFIDPTNIDDAIEHALANPVDYNFALDKNGEKIIGRENNMVEQDKISVKQ